MGMQNTLECLDVLAYADNLWFLGFSECLLRCWQNFSFLFLDTCTKSGNTKTGGRMF